MKRSLGISVCTAALACVFVDLRNSAADDAVRTISPADFGSARAYAASKAKTSPTIDGALDDWDKTQPPLKLPFLGGEIFTLRYRGESDLSADFRVTWDEKSLYVSAIVTDDKHEQNEAPSDLWRHDSIQIAVDPARDRSYDEYADDDVEVGFGLAEDGLLSYRWQPDPTEEPEGLEAAVKRDGQTVTYEAAIAWSALGDLEPKHGQAVGMCLMVNDTDDGEDRTGWLEWTPGVSRFKRPFDFATVLLVDDTAKTPAVAVDIETPWPLTDDGFPGRALVALPSAMASQNVEFSVKIGEGDDAKTLLTGRTAGGKLTQATFSAAPGAIPAGESTISVQAGPTTHGEKVRVWSATALANELLVYLDEKLPILGVDLDLATGYQLERDYSQLALRLILRVMDDAWRDLSVDQSVRAARMAMQLRRVFDRGVVLIKDAIYTNIPQPAVPRYQTGPVKIDGRSFVARTYLPTTGEEEERPIFFNGFGHFEQVRKDLSNWKELATNVIQVEVGPSQIMPAEDEVDLEPFESHVLAALEEAAQTDVGVCVLVSPHYFPQWALEKWPHLKEHSGGFFKHTIHAPEARKIQEAFLKQIVPKLAQQDSLHSICLSNEPVLLDSRKDRATREAWHAYLGKKHGDIATANRLWGTSYDALTAVPVPGPDVPSNAKALPMFYDWCVFNAARLAEWHEWEAGVIKELAPNAPVHAKIMPTIMRRSAIANGVDPERFAKIGAINGNDGWTWYHHDANAEWTHEWQTMNLFLDLQSSLSHAPIFNSENHIIRDRDLLPIPPNHTYTALWQQAVHGQAAETTWVWERTDDPKSDFAGSILHRPEHVYEHGRVHFDLMRLSKEVTALQNAPRPVALLYSYASIVHDSAYTETLERVYTALNFSGATIGFRSERQIAAGEWGDTKVLIVPRATHVPKAVVEAIAAWRAKGGYVVAVGGDSLSHDEYRRPHSDDLRFGLKPRAVSTDLSGAALRDALAKEIENAGVKPSVNVTDLEGKPVWGVEWRTGRLGDRLLVNLVNLTRRPVDVRVHGSQDGWTDMHRQRWQQSRFRLPPQYPMLLQSGQDSDESF